MSSEKKIICIMGPTASGKTAVSVLLAKSLETEIVSADSVQIYKGMDIGSAKPDMDERQGITHHMMDCADIENRNYTVSAFRDDAFRCVNDIQSRGMIPIIVGGSGMYMSCFTSPLRFAVPSDAEIRAQLETEYDDDPDVFLSKLESIDPVSAARLHRNDKKRLVRAMEVYQISGCPFSSFGNDFFNEENAAPPYESIRFGLRMERELLYARINARVDEMIEKGLIEEAKRLYDTVPDHTLPAMLSIGYKQLFDCFDGNCTLNEAVETIKRDTRRFAKRQMTWFKRDPSVHWFDAGQHTAQEIVDEMIRMIEGEWI